MDNINIVDYAIPIVEAQVSCFLQRNNVPACILLDDLKQEALLRMLRHIHKYDSRKGELRTFLEPHTKGAIKDYLRKVEGFSRGHGSVVLISLATNDSRYDVKFMNIPDLRMRTDASIINNPKNMEVILGDLFKRLSARERTILELYYQKRKKNREIAGIFGVNESRISQIRKAALDKLAEILRQKGVCHISQLTE